MLLVDMIKETKMKKIFFKKTTRRWKMLQMDIIENKNKNKNNFKKDMERYEILYIWQKKQSKNNFEEKKRKKWRKEYYQINIKQKIRR